MRGLGFLKHALGCVVGLGDCGCRVWIPVPAGTACDQRPSGQADWADCTQGLGLGQGLTAGAVRMRHKAGAATVLGSSVKP